MNSVAVITPLFNDAIGIVKAINSVKKQDNCNYVHFICDDCSTDNSVEVINTDHDPHICLTINPTNMRQSHSRNVLIEQILKEDFKYIAFLDADDEWLPTHLAESIASLERGYDVVYSTPQWHNGQQDVSFFGITVPRIFIGKQLEINNFIWISSVVLKTECLKDVRFDSNLNGLEDWDMWYTLYKRGCKFVKKDSTTVRYFCNPSGEASRSYLKRDALRQKHNMTMPVTKLNIACGTDYQADYINCDLYTDHVDAKFDVRNIPYEDGAIDEIRALHIIEHFDFNECNKVLKEWHRVLKPNGVLIIETPDFLESCKVFVDSDENARVNLYGHFFSTPWIEGFAHKFLFTEHQLKTQLYWAGFKQIYRISPTTNEHINLAIKAFK